ncbi:MAG: hypothetical protein JXN59_11775, partial [Anaerolineae bacterium]|nr:hypothetical protein [Anaerolineae bacterium]
MTTSPDARQNITELQREAEETLRSKSLLQKALWRLAHDPLTLIAMGVIILLTVLCFSAPAVVNILDIQYNNPDLYNSYLPLGAETSDSNTTTLLIDLETGEVIRPFIGHIQPVLAIAFNAAGTEFLSASDDGSIRLWHIPTGRNKRKIDAHDGPVTGVAFSPDASLFVSASLDGTARLWETEKTDTMAPDVPLFVLEGHQSGLTSATFSPDGLVILTGGEDGSARLWDVTSGELVKTLSGHDGAVNGVAFSPDGAMILTASADNTLRLWNAESGEAGLTLAGHTDAVTSGVFSPDGRLILSGSADN